MKVFKGFGGCERSLQVRKVGDVFQVIARYPAGEDIAPDCWRFSELESAVAKARAVQARWTTDDGYELFADTEMAVSSAELRKMPIRELARALVRASDLQTASDLTAEMEFRSRAR